MARRSLRRYENSLAIARLPDVDLAAGTGQFALTAARHFGRVVAVDVSSTMLAFLRDQAVDAQLSNLDVVRSGLLSYEHTGPLADGVYTRNALHQLPDFWKAVALDRMAGVLRPGGVLRVRDLIHDFAPAEAATVFEIVAAEFQSSVYGGYTCIKG